MLDYIIEYQRTHHGSPSDAKLAQGLGLDMRQVRSQLRKLLNDGYIQFSFTVFGKSIEVM